jgi:hypothetical protein
MRPKKCHNCQQSTRGLLVMRHSSKLLKTCMARVGTVWDCRILASFLRSVATDV